MQAVQVTLDDYKEQLDVIHCDSQGWITVVHSKDNRWMQRHYEVEDLIKDPKLIEKAKIDTYISQNTFYKTYRRLECIKELRNLFMDIDYYKGDYSREQVLMFVEYQVKDNQIPKPNLIIDSGRGLYLIWSIKVVPYQAIPLWNAMQDNFYTKLQDYGADRASTDATRVLRVVGTTNTKTNTKVKILERYDYTYDLKELKHEYLPEIKKREKKAKGRPCKTVRLFNQYTLYASRIKDITRLCELREYDVEGNREHILFLYRYWLCCFMNDTEQALKDTLELNSMFVKPLNEREATRATKSAQKAYESEEKEYKYKNKTLIELLEITEEEQKEMLTLIGTKEKYMRKNEVRRESRRNKEGKTKREIEKQSKIEKVKKFKNKGMTDAEVAFKMGISRQLVARYKV